MIHDKLRNYDVLKKAHARDASNIPRDLDDLPLYQPPHVECDAVDAGGNEVEENPSSESDGEKQNQAIDAAIDSESAGKQSIRAIGSVTPVAVYCGVLPEGSSLYDFHAPPRKIHARNAEALYWSNFGFQVADVFRESQESDPTKANAETWGVTAADANNAAQSQKSFFKAVDSFAGEERCF